MESNFGKNLKINMIHYPVTALGPESRVGIWVQGCSKRCMGCISPHTWDHNKGELKSVSQLAEQINSFCRLGAQGVTISGGEPFEQYPALLDLVKQIYEMGIADILIYTGLKIEEISDKYEEILKYCAAVVDGEYIEGDVSKSAWKGSENQRMIILTNDPFLICRYENYFLERRRKLQVVENGDKLVVIGIPRQNDREEIEDGGENMSYLRGGK